MDVELYLFYPASGEERAEDVPDAPPVVVLGDANSIV